MAASVLVLAVVFVFDLIAFALAVAAEQPRSTAKVVPGAANGYMYCSYDSDIATGYGISVLLLLLASQAVVMAATRCLCCSYSLRPGGARSHAVVLYVATWDYAPSIIFMDEIDSVGSARMVSGTGNGCEDPTILASETFHTNLPNAEAAGVDVDVADADEADSVGVGVLAAKLKLGKALAPADVTAAGKVVEAVAADDEAIPKTRTEVVDAAEEETWEENRGRAEAAAVVETVALAVPTAAAAAVDTAGAEESANEKETGFAAQVLERAAAIVAAEAGAGVGMQKPREGWEAEDPGAPNIRVSQEARNFRTCIRIL